MIKAVILVGGPTLGGQIRPLCSDIPTPFFPIAGVETIYHCIFALSKLNSLSEIILIGFYEKSLFIHFLEKIVINFKIPCKYIQEDKESGTGGGIASNIDYILDSSTQDFLILHCDICSDFPLTQMYEFHKKHGKMATLMSRMMDKNDIYSNYGNLVKNLETNELIHHAEKPSECVSNLMNCGVYIFSKAIKQIFIDERKKKLERYNEIKNSLKNFYTMIADSKETHKDFLTIEKDILMKIASKQEAYIFQLQKEANFWKKLNTAQNILESSKRLMEYYQDDSTIYNKSFKFKQFTASNVLIHYSTHIDPSAQIGPNVTIGAGAKIGKGVRIANSIILEGVEIKDYSCILNSIICWNSSIGYWCRIEGKPNANDENLPGVCLLGVGVSVENEKCIRNCIVLPHKTLNKSYNDDILI